MFVAAKYEEVSTLSLQTVFEKIGHQKLPKSDIKKREADILYAIEFDLTSPTIFDLVLSTLNLLQLDAIIEPQHIAFFQKLYTYLSKLVCQEYRIMSVFSDATIAGAIIYVTFKILQQINKEFDLVSIV